MRYIALVQCYTSANTSSCSVLEDVAAAFPHVTHLRLAHVGEASQTSLVKALAAWAPKLRQLWMLHVAGMSDAVLTHVLEHAQGLEELVVGHGGPQQAGSPPGEALSPLAVKLLDSFSRHYPQVHVEVASDVSINQLWGE